MAVGLPMDDLPPPEEPEGSTMARAESAGSPGVASLSTQIHLPIDRTIASFKLAFAAFQA